MLPHCQDPDIIRWGLHHLDGYPCPSYQTTSPNDAIVDDVGYSGQLHLTSNPVIVENDDIIAHTLQEELFGLAEREASGFSQDDKYLQAIVAQEWFPSKGLEQAENERNMESFSSCTSHEEDSCDEKGSSPVEQINEHFAIDGEVGKRLNHMVPVPHIPKINGEIPSSDVAISDHQRLFDRLQIYNLRELQIEGDGNCQFRALSDQLYRTPEHHNFVREQVVNQLKSHPENYKGYVPMSYEDYLKKMSEDGEWGDHVTLQAASDLYGVKVFIITSFKDTCYIELLPDVEKSKRVLFLSFWAEVHYNSIYPIEEVPTVNPNSRRETSVVQKLQHRAQDTCALM